jgi:CHASE3 domain sensor protein
MDKASIELELNQLHQKISKQIELTEKEPENDAHLEKLKKMLERKLQLEDQLDTLY